MAKIESGILGGVRGKVGTVVGAIWKGIATIRAYVATISNPNSEGQLAQRSKFSTVIAFLKPMASLIALTFRSLAVKQTCFNAAMKLNLKNAITGVFPNFEMDYTKAILSVGSLPGALNPATLAAIAGAIEFTWDDNSWAFGADATDEAVIIVYNPLKGVESIMGGIARSVGTQTIVLPNAYTGDEVQCYIAFKKAKSNVFSDSQYISGIVVS